MPRRRVPSIAWVLSGGTAIGLVITTMALLLARRKADFYAEGDADHYLLIARDFLGRGHAFVDPSEAAYRYGRPGFPFAGWIVGLGRPALMDSTLIMVNLAAITTIPGLAATLLDEWGYPPALGAVVLVPAGLYTLYRDPVAEPLMIALILLAFVLDGRGYRRRALVTLACAVLVKEVAALALVPWMWSAIRRRAWREVGELTSVLAPYAAWCLWVRVRVGEFPFLAQTSQRTGAIGLPFAGIHSTWTEQPHHYTAILALTLATGAVAFVAAWLARPYPIAGLALAFGVLTICLGPNALRFSFEIGRLLAPAQVFLVLALAVAWSARRSGNARATRAAAPEPSVDAT